MKIIIGVLAMVIFTESLFWYRDTVDRSGVIKSVELNRDELVKMSGQPRAGHFKTRFFFTG
jgi:hypothetical protein